MSEQAILRALPTWNLRLNNGGMPAISTTDTWEERSGCSHLPITRPWQSHAGQRSAKANGRTVNSMNHLKAVVSRLARRNASLASACATFS